MRNILYFFFLLPLFVFAQNPTQSENYVKTKVYKVATTSSISTPTVSQAIQNVYYLDGFGKQTQQIVNQYSGTGKNIVIPVEYDAIGRPIKKYLPYCTQTTGLDYESNALSDVQNYSPYQGQNPYDEILYEDSSLSRVTKEAFPGQDWAMGNGHELKFDYAFNDATGIYAVKLFVATANWNYSKGLYDIVLSQTTNYDVNSLYKVIIKNENWTSGLNNTTENFVDKNGRLVLKRIYNGSEVIDTYYVYDQFGNLSYIIPPKADMSITQTILDKLCYQYKYDYRNRLVEKKLPGKQWEFIVYDKLNRIVATGPSLPPFTNLSQSGWMITKYDVYNRKVLTAWMTSASTINSTLRKTKQDERDAETTNFSESRTSSTPDVTISGVTYRYTNLAIPTSGYHVLSVNYYDDYNYPDAPLIPTSVEGQTVFYNNTLKPKEFPTGKWIRASKTSTSYRSELNYILYDNKGRPIRIFMRNHEIGGTGFTQIDNKFNFSGLIDYSITLHKRIGSDAGITIKDFYTYSDQSRLLTHTQQINSQPIQLLSSNTYDELGRLISKAVGNTINSPLQKVDYAYNIRGWLTNINDVNSLTQSGDPIDLFAFKINYNAIQADPNSPSISKQFNGNISETYWRTNNDNILRKYAYKYDNLCRLNYAYYRLPDNVMPSVKSYDEGITYDKNGNIMTLHRTGDVEISSPPIVIDELTYTYDTDSNKLLKVSDNPTTAISGFRDGTNTGDDYSYDANCNMLTDANKGITNIVYNHQNLPLKITFGTNGTIEYLYDADGNKLEKVVTQSSTQTTTKYLDGFQYVNDVIQFFPTSEGYVTKTSSSYKYIFQYKDHLGNVRLSYSKNSTTGNIDILDENNYYPFGLNHFGYNNSGLAGGNNEAQKYKYNGKELQNELGLNMYSYGARNYDAALGRWMNMDPLAEKFNSSSPFTYVLNNPVYFIDSDGLEPTPYEAALMAAHVYKSSGKLVGGWALSSVTKYNIDDNSGQKSSMYERTKGDGTKEYAYIYAGTDDWQDVKNDISQVFGLANQYSNTIEIAKNVSGGDLKNNEVTFVGHSLGGGLSNLSALVTGRTSITFNPAWLSSETLSNIEQARLYDWGNHITNYVHESDPLNRFQERDGFLLGLEETGDTIELEGDFYDGLWNGHFIDNVIDSFEDNDMEDQHEKNGSDRVVNPSESKAEEGWFDIFHPEEWGQD